MARRLALGLILLLAAAAPAAADLANRKESIDSRIGRLQTRIAAAQARENVLRSQIAAVTTEIRLLERRVGDVSTRYQTLARDLYLHQVRLARLRDLFRVQSERLGFLQLQFQEATRRLGLRLIDIYESDRPGTIDVVLTSRSFSEMLEQIDYLKQIGSQDRRISLQVEKAKVDVARARLHTVQARDGVAAATRTIAVRTDQVREVRDELLHSKGRLDAQRHRKLVSLDELNAEQRADAEEIDALRAASASLAARIRSAQAASAQAPSSGPADTTPSSAGLIWPVSAPVTSTFGWRWGRMHEGVDLGAGYGSPVHAAASGTVIYAGWMGGYGNLVVIDHGNGLSTAYGHQSSIAVGMGQSVTQGEVVGYVGSTGHSTGPHLHFEVRVNGAPQDPLGYL